MNPLRTFLMLGIISGSFFLFSFDKGENRTTPPYYSSKSLDRYDPTLAKKVLNGELPATTLLKYRRPGNDQRNGSIDLVKRVDSCTASITVNSVHMPNNPGGDWAIVVILLDPLLNPVWSITMGDCPACNPYFTVGGTGTFPVPMGGGIYDIFFVPDDDTTSAVKVTEVPPCGTGPANPPLFYGDDVYGHWFVDLHQFATLLDCDCCPLPEVQICCHEGYFCLCDTSGVKLSDSPLFDFPSGFEVTWESPTIYAGAHNECFSSPFPADGTPMQFRIRTADCTRNYNVPFKCDGTEPHCDLPNVYLCCHLEKGYVCLCDSNGVQLSQSPLFTNTAVLWSAPSQYAGYTGECLSIDHDPGPLPPVGTPLVFTVRRHDCFEEYHLTYDCEELKGRAENRDGSTVDNMASTGFSITPNPASNTVLISNNTDIAATIKVFDLSGKSVHTFSVAENSFENLDVSNWEDGLYLLQFVDKHGNNAKAIKLMVLK